MTQDAINKVFNDIAGYQEIKDDAKGIVDMLLNQEEYLSHGARMPRGFMLYGDPGMGKTKIVHAISEAGECPLLEISESKAIENNISIDKLIVDVFKQARALEKCIIFIDEIDKFAGYVKFEYEVVDNLKRQKIVMQEMDNITDSGKSIVIATANNLNALSETFLRSGRFDRMLKFHYPNQEDRKAIFELYTRNVKLDDNVDIDNLMLDMAGCSCADIECIANEAVINSVKRKGDTISVKDIISAMRRVTMHDIPKEVKIKDTNKFKATAYHEAGHAFISLYYNKHVVNVSIQAQGESDGCVSNRIHENKNNTKESMEQDIRIGLAGGLATEIFLGTRSGGNISDLARVSKIIGYMCEEGFYGYENCMFTSGNRFSNFAANKDLGLRRQQITTDVMNSNDAIVREILTKNSDTVKRIAEALMDNLQLDYNQLMAIYGGDKGVVVDGNTTVCDDEEYVEESDDDELSLLFGV